MIDLVDFKEKYRLRWDASRQGQERDPWLRQIPCERGHIAPHGDRTLAVYLERRPISAKRVLTEVPGARAHQQADNEISIVFDVDHLDAVAKIVGARRRRKLSEEHKRRLAASNAGSRFKSTVLNDVA